MFIQITDGKTHDVNILDELVFEFLAIYLMNKGYLDFKRLLTNNFEITAAEVALL